jgi:hypothetical protein
MSNTATTDGGTLLTVPANSTWLGSVILSATLAVAIGGAAATARPSVTISPDAPPYSDGDTVVAVALAVPAVAALSLIGGATGATATVESISIQTGDDPATLTLHVPAGITAVAVASGGLA